MLEFIWILSGNCSRCHKSDFYHMSNITESVSEDKLSERQYCLHQYMKYLADVIQGDQIIGNSLRLPNDSV